MTVQTVLCEPIGAKWGHGGSSEAKRKSKDEDKRQNTKKSEGHQGVISWLLETVRRRFSGQLTMSFYRQSAEGAKNGVVGEETPDE